MPYAFFSSMVINLQCSPARLEEVQQAHLVKSFCSMAFQALCVRAQNYFWNLTSITLSLLHSLHWQRPCTPSRLLPLSFVLAAPLPGRLFPQIFPWWAACPGLISHRTCSEWLSLCFSNSGQVSFYHSIAFNGLFWTVFFNLLIVYFLLLKYKIQEITSTFFDRVSKGSDT